MSEQFLAFVWLGTPGCPAMQSEAQEAGRADSEGRYKSAGPVSVAWRSEMGPREQNQDHACCRLGFDGSWLIAVADGLGGHPRGRAAARRAIRALPRRIAGPAEMFSAFEAAHSTVVTLTPSHLRTTMRDIQRCPATTLSVTAWTPASGLVVGIAGDTRVLALWRDSDGWHGQPVGRLHLSAETHGHLVRYLGAPRRWPPMGQSDRDPMDIFTDVDISASVDLDAFAILLASDGAWEPIASHCKHPIGDAIASVLDIKDSGAHSIAARILGSARSIGLTDNATIAVACITGGAT